MVLFSRSFIRKRAVSIAELAQAVSRASGRDPRIEVRGRADPLRPVDRYVPSTARAREELGLRERTSLDEALRRTLHWHRSSVGLFEAMGGTDDE